MQPEPTPYHFLLGLKETENGIQPYFFHIQSKEIHTYNEEGIEISAQKLEATFPYLENNYYIVGESITQGHFKNDTLFVWLSNSSPEFILDYFKEKVIVKLLVNQDTVQLLGQYIQRPGGSEAYKHFNLNYGSWNEESLCMTSSAFDSLFYYNTVTNEVKRIALNNADYNKNVDQFDFSDNNNKKTSASSEYHAHNNSYLTSATLPQKDRWLVFYYTPTKPKNKNQLASPKDRILKGLVVDENGTILYRYDFGISEYHPLTFTLPNGIAIPRYGEEKYNYDTTWFDVFDF